MARIEPNYFGVALGDAIASGAGHISEALQRRYEMQRREALMQEQQAKADQSSDENKTMQYAAQGIKFDPANPGIAQSQLIEEHMAQASRQKGDADLNRQMKEAQIKKLNFEATPQGEPSGGMRGGRKLTPEEEDKIAEAIYNGNVSLADQLSAYQKGGVTAAFIRKYPGEDMISSLAGAKARQNVGIQKPVKIIDSVLYGDPVSKTPSLIDELQQAHDALGTSQTGGLFSAIGNKSKIAYKGLSQDEQLREFNARKANLVLELSNALAGGSPTDQRIAVEVANLDPSIPKQAMQATLEAAKQALWRRRQEYMAKEIPTRGVPVEGDTSGMVTPSAPTKDPLGLFK